MKKINLMLVVIGFYCIAPEAFSQDLRMSRNSVFFELLGNGGLYSINYERALGQKLHARIGYTQWAIAFMQEPETRIQTIPLMISIVEGGKRGHLEIGGGFLIGREKDEIESNKILDITGFFGYRYQKPGNGFLFRIGVTPFISLSRANYPDKFFASAGLSLGYHF